MVIWVMGPDALLSEWKMQSCDSDVTVLYSTALLPAPDWEEPDAIFYLHDSPDSGAVEWLKGRPANMIFLNAVTQSFLPNNYPVIRLNGWPGFLGRPVAELSTADNQPGRPEIEALVQKLGRKVEWVPDCAGMLTPRVLAMIINEAWFALEEGVSTAEEIDLAMRLGTNYPFGPIEWGKKIGLSRIVDLLSKLEQEDSRYRPCEALKNAALA